MRNYLTVLVIGLCTLSFSGQAQILEEMSPEQLEGYIDTLLEEGRIEEADAEYLRYYRFLPIYQTRMSAEEHLLEVYWKVNSATSALICLSQETRYTRLIPRLEKLVQLHRSEEARWILLSYKKEIPAAASWYAQLMALPMDTLHVHAGHLPIQLYANTEQLYYRVQPALFLDSALLYAKKDAKPYTGVIVSRECPPESMETGAALLTFDHYTEGRLIGRKIQAYVRTQDLHANTLFPGYNSNHYQCITETHIDRSDTVRTLTYAGTWVYMEELAVKSPHGYLEAVRNIVYTEDGSIALWQEKTAPTEAHQAYDYYECWVNQRGDTLSELYELHHGDQYITSERRLDAAGDTVLLLRTVDGLLDGLQIQLYATDPDASVRYRCSRNKVEDILSPELTYFDAKWKVVDKAHFLEALNREEIPTDHILPVHFRAYLPDYAWVGNPVFLSMVLPDAPRDFRRFTKACKKAFKLKKQTSP